MSAWQNPTDACPQCGQDILLRPEVTPDIRMIYVRYCPRCDDGEPVMAPEERPWAARLDADQIWGRKARRERSFERVPVSSATRARSGPVAASARTAASSDGVDLWWDGAGGPGPSDQLEGIDARWARFAARGAGDEDEDDLPLAAKGTFSFSVDDAAAPRRRSRLPHLLRRSA